jgi:serine protease inhibitor
MTTKRTGSKVFWAMGIVFVLIAASVTFYLLLMGGDEDPLMSMNFSDKVLVETGSTDTGQDHSVASLNQFAVDMYRKLARNNSDNVFFSPLSLYIALSMAMEGARGDTFTAMRDTLRIVDDNVTRRGSFASIQNDLNSREGCELSLVNNVWVRDNVVIKPDFKDTIRDYYMASIEKAPFATDPEGARKIINDRILSETNGRIEDLVPPDLIDGLTAAILTNAIYFKGQWKYGFDPDDTSDQYFIRADGEHIKVPMMEINPEYKIDEIRFMASSNQTAEALRLDYRESDISMLFVLPGGRDEFGEYRSLNISDIESVLDRDYIADTNDGLRSEEIMVRVPKFSFETDYDMEKPLTDLGMGLAFRPEADFSGMLGGVWIDETLQKAFLSVDESGTEAASATLVEVTADMPTQISLDHPFIFAIQDNQTGLILFMGRIMDPTK